MDNETLFAKMEMPSETVTVGKSPFTIGKHYKFRVNDLNYPNHDGKCIKIGFFGTIPYGVFETITYEKPQAITFLLHNIIYFWEINPKDEEVENG
jgi:hypothetical protein